MKIAMANDHAGTKLKNEIKAYLESEGHEVKDFGTYDEESCDLSDFVYPAALAVAKGECDRGILICGTGIGISIAANKVPSIRCALCGDCFSAKATRLHNNANVLALGALVTGPGLALEIVDIFLDTPFSEEERHSRRVSQLEEE